MSFLRGGIIIQPRESVLVRALQVLNKRDKRRIILVIFLQVFFSLLDLIGVAVIGMIGALAIRGVSSKAPGDKVGKVLDILGLANKDLQSQVAVLGLIAVSMLITKTIFSAFFTRRLLLFLSSRSAQLSSDLYARLISQNLVKIQNVPIQSRIYSITTGVDNLLIGVISSIINMVVDSSLLIVLGIGLFLVDPLMSLSTFTVFGIIGYSLYLIMHKRAAILGEQEANLTIRTNGILWESFESYREIVSRNRRSHAINSFAEERSKLSETKAQTAFLPNVTKYVIEIAVVVMALILCAVQFSISDATHAFGVLTVFMAASTRIAPAVLRIQQSTVMIRSRIGSASGTIDLFESVSGEPKVSRQEDEFSIKHPDFNPEVIIEGVNFSYPEKTENSISDFDLRIKPGSITALVGRSGAGKSTLADLILGIVEPSEGKILISGHPPLVAISKWPGSIGYVPQEVLISSGTIRQNLALGFNADQIPEILFWEALEIAQLDNFVTSLPDGLDTLLGDRGAKLSGGQRQRMGIARALFTKPGLLILDEATSAMDGKTEFQISEAIQELKGSVTIVIVAHRLSTLRSADQILYLHEGRVAARGTFEDLRKAVPDFDEQANLMGL